VAGFGGGLQDEDRREPVRVLIGRHILGDLAIADQRAVEQAGFAAGTVTLKLKTAEFRLRTRSHTLADPTQLAEMLFQNAKLLLAREADGTTRFRLIGVGADALVDAGVADLPTLFDRELDRPRRLADTIDNIRSRHGTAAVQLGRGLATLPPSTK